MTDCVAYIDGANLHKGIAALGWKLDYGRFRSWIRQKYGVSVAKLFIGLMPGNASLYTARQSQGYQCVFKDVIYCGDGKVKGNCDADLVLHAVRDYYEHHTSETVLISSDGDYTPLIRFWQEKQVSCTVLSPALIQKCSILIKRTGVGIVSLQEVRMKIERLLK